MKINPLVLGGVLLLGVVAYAGRLAWRAHRDLVSLKVYDVDVKKVLKKMEWQTWESIYASAEATGRVTLELESVPLEQALTLISEQLDVRWTALYPLYTKTAHLKTAGKLAGGELKAPQPMWTNWGSRGMFAMNGGPGGPGGPGRGGPDVPGPQEAKKDEKPVEANSEKQNQRPEPSPTSGTGDATAGSGATASPSGAGNGGGSGRGPGGGGFGGGFGGPGGFGGFGEVEAKPVTLKMTAATVPQVSSELRQFGRTRLVAEDGTTLRATFDLKEAPMDKAVGMIARSVHRNWAKLYVLERGGRMNSGPPPEMAQRPQVDPEQRRQQFEQLAATPEFQQRMEQRENQSLVNRTPAQRVDRDRQRAMRQQRGGRGGGGGGGR